MNYVLEVSFYLGCKINCSYCPQNILYKNTSIKKMTPDEYKTFISSVPSDVEIAFCGMSEPLLYEHFSSLAYYTHKKGHSISCFTTLATKNKENIQTLFDDNIWKRRCVHIIDEHMSCKIDDEYLSNIEKFFLKIEKNDREKNTISILTKSLDFRINDMLKKYNIEHLPYYEIPYMRIKSPIHRYKDPIVPKKLEGKIYCSQNHDKIQHLLPDGNVVICCMDVEKKHILGNLKTQTYNSLFSGSEYKKIIKGFDTDLNTICRNCIMAKNY